MGHEHERWMRVALEEAELARGTTGDNPWVGCVIVSPGGEVLGRGHTLGPGEDHAEIAAARDAHQRGHSVVGTTLYSTLEPCSFHGRTPACAQSIAERGIARVVTGMRDPHPRVDGAGILILRNAGVEVVEGVCEPDVRRQLGAWVLEQHPHEPLGRARRLPEPQRLAQLAETYGVDRGRIEAFLASHGVSSDETVRSHPTASESRGAEMDASRDLVTSEADLRAIVGTPGPRAIETDRRAGHVSEMTFDLTRSVAVLERTAGTLRALLDGLPREWTEATEGPDTWSPYTVVGHLIHGERTDWIPRAQIILAQGPDLRFTPYDRFAQFRESQGRSLAQLLDEFGQLRAENLGTLRQWHLTDVELALTGEHPAFGPVTLRQLIATWVAHDLGHVAQITRVMARQYREAVGPWRAYLSIMDR